ncbi:hypothetical protein [Henriciella pelagia]|uniref:Uncharacterized protein n=1 Tax=Henriciella pelagia TaxID=1977912 RepID=A0ABQ1JVX0_9PROT|nr:hypothetical protein [Henriciella pelagia]GGB78691.1 hypothetical protein GCM10011503_29410 [Henriciella pelagia]
MVDTGEVETAQQEESVVRGRHLDRLNRWLTLAANLGVLLGLIVLIIEVRQNASLTHAAMDQQKNNFLAEIELNIAKPEMSAIWVKAIRTPEALSDTEVQAAGSILVSVMLQWDQMFMMRDAGLISDARVRQHISNTAPFYFGSRFAKHWWAMQAAGWEGTAMQRDATPIVDAVDENFLSAYMDRLKIPAASPAIAGLVEPVQ